MTPLDLLARLAALIPPPRHPLVRFHGAFAPRSSWRRDVVPKPRDATPKSAHEHNAKPRPAKPHGAPAALIAQTQQLAPNVLSIRHWDRLQSGALVAASARVDWPTLMRRTFDTDVLECPRCDGRLHIIAIVDDQPTARKILDELHIPRARAPPNPRDPALLFEEPTYTDAP